MADSGEILDDLPDGVVIADAAGRVTRVNAAAERLLDIDAVNSVGRSLSDVLPLSDTAGRPWWEFTDPYSGLRTRSGQPEVELFLPTGSSLLVTARYVRAAGPQTPVTSVLVCFRGTTRGRAHRDRAELVATVAHELRSPLTSVKGFTATLLAKWDLFTDAQRRLMLETIEADADRVTRLITELLDVARIDSGRLELHRVLVDLPAMLRGEVARLIARGEVVDRFDIDVVRPDLLPETWADADKLDQVFLNLLENAVRHGAGKVTVLIEPDLGSFQPPVNGAAAYALAGRAADIGSVLTVTDQGDGVPAAAVGRVFSRFWRGGRRGGTGLGLYIAKGLIEAHGGTIALVSQPGQGAAFRVHVPAGKPPG